MRVRIGPSTVAVWAGAAITTALAVLESVNGKQGSAAVMAGLTAGLLSLNNLARSWQAGKGDA